MATHLLAILLVLSADVAAAQKFHPDGIQVIDGGGGRFPKSTCITNSSQTHLNGTIISGQCCSLEGLCLRDSLEGFCLAHDGSYQNAAARCKVARKKLCDIACDKFSNSRGCEMFPVWTSLPCTTTTTTTPPGRCFQLASMKDLDPGVTYCPKECPFTSVCRATEKVQCVRAQDCDYFDKRRKPVNTTADGLRYGGGTYCMECRIAGCVSCDKPNICSECQSGMVLSNGKCISNWLLWIIPGGVCAFIFLWIFIDFLVACCRPNKNKRAISEALRYRSHCHLRDHTRLGHPMYRYLSAPVHSHPIGGPGMPLFFNWFLFVALVAIYLSALAYVYGGSGWAPADDLDDVCVFLDNPRASDRFSDPQTVTLDFDTKADLPKRFEDRPILMWTSLSYGGTLLMTIIFFVYQRSLWLRLVGHKGSSQPMLQHYAIEATGFPPDAIDNAELNTWMKLVVHELGLSRFSHNPVMEVSVSYVTQHVHHKVTTLLDSHLQDMNRRRAGRAMFADGSYDVAAFEKDGALDPEEAAKQRAGTFWVQLLAFVFLGADMHCCRRRIRGYTPTVEVPDSLESNEMLSELQCSGSVIFVMSSVEIRNQLIQKCRKEVPKRFRQAKGDMQSQEEERVIKFKPVREEPEGILWQNFGRPARTQGRRFVIAIFLIILTVCAWIALFFFWARFSMWTVGHSAAIAISSLMALSIAAVLGNALLAQVIFALMSYIGFKYKGNRKRTYLGLMVFVNCFLVILLEFAVVCYHAITRLSPDLPIKFYYEYGMRLSMEELAGMLIPVYILLPYIGQPIATILVPYWVGIFRVKGDKRIGRGHAERLLQAPEIDIVNTPYTDLICNATAVMICFLAPSNIHKILMPALAVFAVFSYLMARKRILSWQTSITIGTDDLHRLESYLWALPLGLLAANLGVHVVPVDVIPVGNSDDLVGHKWLILGGIFFVGHVFLHFLFVRCVLPVRISTAAITETYEEASKRNKGATYQSTNPIEVLKSCEAHKKRPEDNNHLVFYRVGKEHLQPNAHRSYKEAGGAHSLSSVIKEFAWEPEEQLDLTVDRESSVPEFDVLFELLGFEAAGDSEYFQALKEQVEDEDEHQRIFPVLSREPEEVEFKPAERQQSEFVVDSLDMGKPGKLCKRCNRKFVENQNFDWSCRIHTGNYEGGMWECCGAMKEGAAGCYRTKHESDEVEEAKVCQPASLAPNSSPQEADAPVPQGNPSLVDGGSPPQTVDAPVPQDNPSLVEDDRGVSSPPEADVLEAQDNPLRVNRQEAQDDLEVSSPQEADGSAAQDNPSIVVDDQVGSSPQEADGSAAQDKPLLAVDDQGGSSPREVYGLTAQDYSSLAEDQIMPI